MCSPHQPVWCHQQIQWGCFPSHHPAHLWRCWTAQAQFWSWEPHIGQGASQSASHWSPHSLQSVRPFPSHLSDQTIRTVRILPVCLVNISVEMLVVCNDIWRSWVCSYMGIFKTSQFSVKDYCLWLGWGAVMIFLLIATYTYLDKGFFCELPFCGLVSRNYLGLANIR